MTVQIDDSAFFRRGANEKKGPGKTGPLFICASFASGLTAGSRVVGAVLSFPIVGVLLAEGGLL